MVFSALPLPGALLLLAGCTHALDARPAVLPTQLAVLVEREGRDEPVSLVLDLRRNARDQLDVRVSGGARLWDGRHLWELTPTEDARGHGLRVADLRVAQGGDVPLFADAPLRLLALDRQHAWIALPNGARFRCALERPECKEAAPDPLPMDHPGPGGGFHLRLEAGALSLDLPQPEDGQALLMDGVRRVIGVHWVHEGWLEQDPMLDRTYRGQASLVAEPHAVEVDGALGEWSGAQPLVVDAPWQIDSGGDHWTGPQDASFSVAAAVHDGALCVAGRVRDDAFTDADHLTVRVGAATLDVPLTGADADAASGGAWFSRTFEACLPTAAAPAAAFAVQLHDHDPDGVTVLASAPEPDGRTDGTVRVR